MKEHNEFAVILEDIDHKFTISSEGFETFRDVPARLDRLEADVSEIKVDVKVIKGVVREHSADINELKARSHSH